MGCPSLFSFFLKALFEPVAIPVTADDTGFVGQSIQPVDLVIEEIESVLFFLLGLPV